MLPSISNIGRCVSGSQEVQNTNLILKRLRGPQRTPYPSAKSLTSSTGGKTSRYPHARRVERALTTTSGIFPRIWAVVTQLKKSFQFTGGKICGNYSPQAWSQARETWEWRRRRRRFIHERTTLQSSTNVWRDWNNWSYLTMAIGMVAQMVIRFPL